MMTALPAPLISLIVDITLLAMLLVIAGAIIITRSLLASILLMSVYSLVVAVWFVVLDAPDVAFTEAAVGAGVSTVILLGATLLVRAESEKRSWRSIAIPALVALGTGAILIYAATGLPEFGDAASPANTYVGRGYLETTPTE